MKEIFEIKVERKKRIGIKCVLKEVGRKDTIKIYISNIDICFEKGEKYKVAITDENITAKEGNNIKARFEVTPKRTWKWFRQHLESKSHFWTDCDCLVTLSRYRFKELQLEKGKKYKVFFYNR